MRQYGIQSNRGRVLLVGALLSLLGFVALAAPAMHGTTLQLDRDAHRLVHIARQPVLDDSMRLVSRLGESSGLLPLIALGVVCLWARDRRWAIALPALMAGTGLLQLVSKWAVDRPRPNLLGWGFPSGHVLSVVVFFGLMTYLLCVSARGRARRWAGFAVCATTVLAVAFSRVYLDAHWVSDVAGGFTLGVAYLLIAIWLAESIAAGRRPAIELGRLGLALDPLTIDALEKRFPGLAADLSRSRGVGFVLARSETGPVCFWRGARYRLGGADPGPFAGRPDRDLILRDVIALMDMPSAGDLVIYGTDAPEGHVSYIPESGAHAGPSPEEFHTFIVAQRDTLVPPITHPVQLCDVFVSYQEGHTPAHDRQL